MLEILKHFTKYGETALATIIIGILMVLLFPIHTMFLDILFASSIAIALIILMSTLFIRTPLELSAFPTMLLVTTLLRLSLNIASTRLILAKGHQGSDAAGYVIEAFGGFVMQGNVVIGLIVFLILTLINFIVITKGSGRIAEVAARFSLDAMPGKQMAIDADLAAGLIDEQTAKTRRKNLENESAFYGAMDGANKFVRGDAIAGLVITFINLIGGMIVGILQKNLTFETAVKTYTILTIGDGLVSQIPSLIISLSAGLLVTKSGTSTSSNKMIFEQLSKYPNALFLTSLVTGMMALLPGLPTIPFLAIAILSAGTGYLIKNIQHSAELEEQASAKAIEEGKNGSTENNVESDIIHLDTLSLEIGSEIMVSVQKNEQTVMDKIKNLRQQLQLQLGFIMPAIRVRDNIQLNPCEYVIKVKEIIAGKGFIRPDKLLMIHFGKDKGLVPGEETVDPSFKLPAKWIHPNHKNEALFYDFTVIEPYTVIMTHVSEIVKEHIKDMLSYADVKYLIDNLHEEFKPFVKDVIPDIVPIGTLQKVLQSLLSEMVSIRDLPKIIEIIADTLPKTQNITAVTEQVRQALSRQICDNYTNEDGLIHTITLSEKCEKIFMQHLMQDKQGNKQLILQPSYAESFLESVRNIFDKYAQDQLNPVLLTNQNLRIHIRNLIAKLPLAVSIPVVSITELQHKIKIRTLEQIDI